MFEFKEKVKKLPMPELKESLERYKEVVRPLLTEEEFINTCKTADAFISEASCGTLLDKTLEEKCLKNNSDNWLIDLWIKMYLEHREEIAVNVNYYAVLENDEFNKNLSHSEILATAINSVTTFYFSILDEGIKGQKSNNVPLCMNSFKYILGGTRIADYGMDSFSLKSSNRTSNHIIFIYMGHMYKITVSDKNGIPYKKDRIAKAIDAIIDECSKSQASEGIGIISSAKRDKSAFLKKKLSHSINNCKNFGLIEESIAVFCLDKKTKYGTDFSQSFLLSTGKNRFFDKSTQFILTDEKELGINCEHSHADASPYTLLLKQVYDDLCTFNDDVEEGILARAEYSKLEWDTNSEVKMQLNQTSKEHQKHMKSKFTKHLPFLDFGREKIKKLGMSPDAFFHLSLQVAQFRTFKSLESTYESIDMRDYRDGRTECHRPLNLSSKRFAESFDTLLEKKSYGELKELGNEAANRHVSSIKDIKEGKGVERYLFGLEEMNKNFVNCEESNKFFNDIAYKRLKSDFLSTSGYGADFIKAFGFGNIHKDGYGIGYSVNSQKISITISTEKHNREKAKELAENLHNAFRDLAKVMEE